MAKRRNDMDRGKFIATAERLILDKGANDFSLADLAKTMGISKGTLYYHYPTKDELILDIMDYLLGAEGTKLAVYGIKGYDYTEDGAGNIALTENGWPKDDSGDYVEKENGAKCLRYMVTLGNDYDSYDPLTDREAYGALSGWQSEMDAAEASSLLRVFKEKSEVMWLSTDLKDRYEGSMLEDANDEVVKYCYGKEDKAAYLDNVTKSPWPSVLSEINGELGYGK